MRPPTINLKIKNVTFQDNKDLMDITSHTSDVEMEPGDKTAGESEPLE